MDLGTSAGLPRMLMMKRRGGERREEVFSSDKGEFGMETKKSMMKRMAEGQTLQ